MRILIGGQTYAPARNGQAVFTTHLAEGLARRGHQVHVVLPSEHLRPYTVEHHGVTVHHLWAIPLTAFHPHAFLSPAPGGPLRHLLGEIRPQVIHVQDHYSLGQALVRLAQERGIPRIGTNHFVPANLAPYFRGLNRLGALLEHMLWQWMLGVFNRLDLITAPSRTAATLLRLQGCQVPVVPLSCGVDCGRFRPDPDVDRGFWRRRYGLAPRRTVFLFVGRVDPEKRLDVLLSALTRLPREDLQLAIAGQGTDQERLQELARRWGLADRVRFLGFVPDREMPALLNSVDIFAMPSTAELLSIATLEAMACGRPVLAARALALPELVQHRINGRLFRPNDPDDAAAQMAWLTEHPEEWPRLSRAARTVAEAHCLEHTLQRYEALYHQLCAARPRGLSRAVTGPRPGPTHLDRAPRC